MGKAAGNERGKLKATFLNNVAIGVVVAGFFAPYVTLFARPRDTMYTVLLTGFAMFFCVGVAVLLRLWADQVLKEELRD